MNLAWIVKGIRDMKSDPIRTSMDQIYSLIRSDDSDEGQTSGKRKRRDAAEDYDYDHNATKRTTGDE